jgi:thymidylate synthase
MQTLEVTNVHVCLEDAHENVIVNQARNLNYRFMVAEWLWILFGLKDVQTIARYNKEITKFSDDGLEFYGAYGPRIRAQWNHLVKSLKTDSMSRQAVVTIWTPNPPITKDTPCTVSLQFLLRDDKLNCIATMRSSDAWLGFPYDLFNFSQLTNYLAACLDVQVGYLAMNLGSSHLYAPNFGSAANVVGERGHTRRSPKLTAPAPAMILHTLKSEPVEHDDLIREPWLRYACVLGATSRQDALRFL